MLTQQMPPWQMESVLDIPRTYQKRFIKIGSVTDEKLLTLSFCGWVDGVVCKVILASDSTKVMLLGWGKVGILTTRVFNPCNSFDFKIIKGKNVLRWTPDHFLYFFIFFKSFPSRKKTVTQANHLIFLLLLWYTASFPSPFQLYIFV